jgi:hypothetical protein
MAEVEFAVTKARYKKAGFFVLAVVRERPCRHFRY